MVDQQLLEDDLEARQRSLDVSNSYIVQAPAGSGKTELLIQRYLKLLSVVDNPEEVLAITFTRKAASEMQYRVLSALMTAHRGEQPAQEHQRLTNALACAALQRDSELGWQLIANPRRMRIQTLDSLNALIARLRPISSPESASGARIVDGAELKTLYQLAAFATLDWLPESGRMSVATREVLTHVDNNTGIFTSYLERMLATRDQWLPFVGSGKLSVEQSNALRQRFELHLEYAVRNHIEKTAALFSPTRIEALGRLQRYAAGNLHDSGAHANPICELRDIDALADLNPDSVSQWQGLAELLLTKSGSVRKTVTKNQGFPTGDSGQKDEFRALLTELAGEDRLPQLLHGIRSLPPVRYTDEQWQVLLALFRLLPMAVLELKRLFAEQGVSDYTEIAMTAAAALGSGDSPGDVALLLDYQVRHLLVDEMQDTSHAQYRMLEALTGGWEPGDDRTLFCVGDPMQSIYRFRNAEVGQFLLAKKHGIGSIQLTALLLRRNFRSGDFLVDWFNTVFPGILAAEDDPLSGAVSYSEAVSVPQLAGQGRCHVIPVFGSSAEQEAKIGCQVVADTLKGNPDDEMAVLVRGRTQLPQLLAELRRARIPFRAVDIDRLTDLPEVIEVLALTRAAAHQGDRLAWLAILRAAWIGLDWFDLHALVVNDAHSTVWDLLQDERRLAPLSEAGRQAIENARSVLAALLAPRRTGSLRELVETCWMRLGGPAILHDEYEVANVYRYFDVLEKHERCGSLVDVAELESMLDLERVSSNIDARLQIMTMHRAKGLEFEHVVLFGLGRLPGSGERSVMSWFDLPDEHGTERKIVSPVGPRADLAKDPVHRFIELSEAAKDRHEHARLLYVACTRARKSLHLVGNVNMTTDGEAMRPPAKGTLLSLLWSAVEPQFSRAFESHVVESSADDTSIWAMPVLRRFESAWTLPPVADLPGVTPIADTSAADEQVEFYWVGTEARIAGTIVHRWLHALAEQRATLDPESLLAQRPITARWLKEIGVGDAMRANIMERVETALQQTLSDETGRWIVSGEGHAEFGLTGIYAGNIESVILDRVRIDDGVHWIIDYKTSSHEGGNLAGFLRAETDRYRQQLEKYAAIYNAYADTRARCALYFPLLQTFLEVEV